jgi:hypothetical protein
MSPAPTPQMQRWTRQGVMVPAVSRTRYLERGVRRWP